MFAPAAVSMDWVVDAGSWCLGIGFLGVGIVLRHNCNSLHARQDDLVSVGIRGCVEAEVGGRGP